MSNIVRCACVFFFFQAEDGIRDVERSRGLGDVYKRQVSTQSTWALQNTGLCLTKKELFIYKKQTDKTHKSMRNLSSSFVKEEPQQLMEGMSYFPFTLIFSQIRSKKYFTSTKEECKKWLEEIKDAIGYANLQDYYDIKESLGKGKFGIVKCGVHKKTGKRVAIKVMKKSSMSTQDKDCLLYTSPSPRDLSTSRMPSSA
eukprot:TRINITY_DN35942_c0_g2_i1.p1 TRINITY_DN35942_c0_g2~~TRINITY_DN35942_c0_g2_i1.p1  ORF type:complete len:199 (-),score=61.51 TRINITY_DN35942_c0_g2_i1:76-672(-)